MRDWLTDHEISLLRLAAFHEPASEDRDEVMRATFIALDRRFKTSRRDAARRRCLEAWNARPGLHP